MTKIVFHHFSGEFNIHSNGFYGRNPHIFGFLVHGRAKFNFHQPVSKASHNKAIEQLRF
jgi:hypothetical protein